jgi:class 3 adenylate cyclase
MTEQRRLAAIVSAGVAGYSRMMGQDEGSTLAALKALRQDVVDPAIASHGGRIVKTTGDGCDPLSASCRRCRLSAVSLWASDLANL